MTERAELIARYPALAKLPSDSGWTFFTSPSLAETRKLNALVRSGDVDANESELPSGKPITFYRWSKTSKYRSQIGWLQDDLAAFATDLLARKKG